MEYEFPKPIMTISELAKMGFPERQLKEWVHIRGFPASKMSVAKGKNCKWRINTNEFGKWLKKYKNKLSVK